MMTSRVRISVCIVIFLHLFQDVRCAVDPKWMKETLTNHFSESRHHKSNPAYKMAARDFIAKEFKDMGLDVVNHTFDTRLPDVQGVNVIGILKSQQFNMTNDTMVAIGAHYDTMRDTPGVNDNGAGVVTLLQAARELSNHPERNGTVLFIAFDLEENENENDAACSSDETLCGSKKLVSDWLPTFQAWPMGWKGIAVMDTILNFDDKNKTQNLPFGIDQVFRDQYDSVQSDGRQGDFMTVAGRTADGNLVDLFNSSWYRLGELEYEIEIFELRTSLVEMVPDLSRSDHASFWDAGAGALFLTDTANFRGYMQQCYHERCDNITYITDERMEFVAKTAGALVSWVDKLAPKISTGTSGADRSQPFGDRMTTSVAAACVVILMLRQLVK